MGLIKDIRDIEQLSLKEQLQSYDIVQDREGDVYMYLDTNEDLKSLIPNTTIPNISKSDPIFLDISDVSGRNDRNYIGIEYFNNDLAYDSNNYPDWDIMSIYRSEYISPKLKEDIKSGKIFNLNNIFKDGYGYYKLIWRR